MGINFKVSMVLEAINNMSPGVRRAMDAVDKLKHRTTSMARETSGLNPVAGWSDKIAQVSRRMDEIGRKAANVRKEAEKLMASGMRDIAAGGSIAMPVLATIKPAADLQTTFTTMQVMGLSDKGKEAVRRQSMDLAKNLAFDLSQVVGVAWALQKAGMNETKMLKAQRVATNYAQLEYNRYGADPNQTATHLAHIAESSGVFYATKEEREANHLRTQSDIDDYIVGKFERMTETLNKVVAVTSSDTAMLAESIKYSMSTAKSLGWSEESAMLMSGIYSRFGIEGSMSGTHLKDFAARLNPYQHYIDEDAGAVNKRLTAMQAAGWLDGAQWATTKAGKKKFYSVGQSAFHNKDGTLKGPDEIFNKIYEAYERFNSRGERLQFEGILHDVLGEQGKDIAQLLNQNPEMFKHIKSDMSKVLSMEKSLDKYQKNVNTQWDIFTGNIKTASTLMGELLLDDLGDTLKGWNEKLFGKNGEKSPTAQWIEDNKEMIAWTMKAVVVFGGLTTGIGILKIVAAGVKFGFISPLMTGIGLAGKLGTRIKGVYDGFKYFRGKGGGLFESLWKGAQFALPWLGKLMTWVRRFTPFFLRNAARIAAGWLIAMGPPGWIILGVTALIATAILAWKNNFMGFRDKCTEVWNWLKDYTEYIFPGLYKSIGEFIEGAKQKWSDLKEWIGEKWNGAVKSTSEVLGAMRSLVKKACEYMGIDFDTLTDKVSKLIQKLWDLHPTVQAYKGIKNHLESFGRWREWKGNVEQRDYLKNSEENFEPTPFYGGSPKKESALGLGPKPSQALIQLPRFQNDTPYQSQPYIVQPLVYGGGQTQGFKQTNNIRVDSHKEAAEFVRQAVPDKYKSSGNNPRNHVGISYGAVGELV